MAIENADILHLDNGTTVDTAAGIDIRRLNASAVASDEAQSCRIAVGTGGNNNQQRTFDPASTLVTASADADSFQGEGYALRLSEDMTPDDDTNCNAMLDSGTVAVIMRVRLNATGGTNLGGACTIQMKASLWRYDPDANTGVLIAVGATNQTWNTSAVGAENNTLKNTTVNIAIASPVEFAQGEILLLQVGFRGTTLVNPSVGTTNYDLSLEIGAATSTRIDFATGQSMVQVCFFEGTASGTSTALGVLAPVLPAVGTSAGVATASGVLEAEKLTTGVSSGVATGSGALSAVIETVGTASGTSTASGVPAIVVPTVGTSEVGGGGGTTIIKKPIYIFGD